MRLVDLLFLVLNGFYSRCFQISARHLFILWHIGIRTNLIVTKVKYDDIINVSECLLGEMSAAMVNSKKICLKCFSNSTKVKFETMLSRKCAF
jgi:hypothetical protein